MKLIQYFYCYFFFVVEKKVTNIFFIFKFVEGVVYYTLGNISPKHRSQLGAIQLLAVATSPVIKKYGIDSILEPFMEDLHKLEQVCCYNHIQHNY